MYTFLVRQITSGWKLSSSLTQESKKKKINKINKYIRTYRERVLLLLLSSLRTDLVKLFNLFEPLILYNSYPSLYQYILRITVSAVQFRYFQYNILVSFIIFTLKVFSLSPSILNIENRILHLNLNNRNQLRCISSEELPYSNFSLKTTV